MIDFGAACKDLFSTERKWMTILGLCVCMLIPIVGQMVSIGYFFRRFAREREGEPAEDFDFNLFGEYLKIGLWPTLTTMVASLILVPIVILFMIPIFLGAFLVEENKALAIIIMIAGTVLYCAAIFVFMLFLYPIMIRSGLMMDFKEGFSKSFILGFVRKVGGSLLLHYLLLMLVAFPLIMVGYLALVVGAFGVAAWVQFTMFHLVFQHYDLYLERGGERVEVNPEVTKNYSAPPLPRQSGPAA